MSEDKLTLVLNASEGILQVVIGQGSTVLVHQEWDCPQKSTEKLTPLLKGIFSELGKNLSEIGRIACVIGAGSFTGIRLTLATSSALARITGAKQVGIDFLQALAFNAPTVKGTHTRVITHAKKNLVHSADFICSEDRIPLQVSTTELLSPDEVLKEPAPNFLLGSGTLKISSETDTSTCILSTSANILNPRVLLNLANTLPDADGDINPDYVRSCDAVDNLEHISKKLGNDVSAAFKMYHKIVD